MKKLLLTSALLALLASPGFAYVQGGDVINGGNTDQAAAGPKDIMDGGVKLRKWVDGTPNPESPFSEPAFVPLSEGATRPIPEPGTMVLASLGLLALGASRARRRGR